METGVAVLLLAVMAALGGYSTLRRHRRLPRYLSAEDKALVHVRWHELEQQVAKGGRSRFENAIVEADKLVDHCLKQLGVPGDNLGERLRNSRNRFSDYQGMWDAHKARNQIVHEVDKEVLSFEAKSVMAKFKRALTDLGAL